MAVDLEPRLVAAGTAEMGDVRFCTELPAQIPAKLVQVNQLPNSSRGTVSFEDVRVDFDSFAADRHSAKVLADAVDDFVTGQLPGRILDGVLIVAVTGGSAGWVNYDNPNVRRMIATYTFRTKSPV